MTKQQAKEVLKMVEPTRENIEKIIDMIDEQTVTTTPYIPIEYPYPYQRQEITTDGKDGGLEWKTYCMKEANRWASQ